MTYLENNVKNKLAQAYSRKGQNYLWADIITTINEDENVRRNHQIVCKHDFNFMKNILTILGTIA